MDCEPDMEMTPEREKAVKNALIRLWEDQYGYRLERVEKDTEDGPA